MPRDNDFAADVSILARPHVTGAPGAGFDKTKTKKEFQSSPVRM